MVLALDFVERIAHRAKEVGIGILNLAIHPELDHGLRLGDRVKHAGVQALDGDIAPFQDIADVIALGVEDAVDEESDLQPADGDFGADRQTRGVGQELTLMRRIFMERVDAGPDDLVGAEGRQIERKAASFCFNNSRVGSLT